MPSQVLQPGTGPIRSRHYLPADPGAVLWGRLPCATDTPVLTIDAGDEVTIDTISHEGIHEDQGRDPVAFFAGFGVDPDEVLTDAAALAASDYRRDPAYDGPHVVPDRCASAVPAPATCSRSRCSKPCSACPTESSPIVTVGGHCPGSIRWTMSG
jgi:hypothetical protein